MSLSHARVAAWDSSVRVAACARYSACCTCSKSSLVSRMRPRPWPASGLAVPSRSTPDSTVESITARLLDFRRKPRMKNVMPESIVTYRGAVYPWHCDHMGHMNVMWYVGKFDEATWQLLASVGLTPTRLRQDSIGMVAVEQRTEYKRELRAGDLLTVRSFVQEAREKSVLLV